MNTDTGNTTAVFIQNGCITKQHPGWYLQKVNKEIILPRIATIPFSAIKVDALPSGYWKADHISLTPVTEVEYFTDEGEQFPSAHKKQHFIIKMGPDQFQYFMVISDKKAEFSKNFEILLEDWFKDMWFGSPYAYIAYARVPGSAPVPVTIDNFGTLCISPF